MQRLFSTFPDGLPAIGLLLLRITLATTCWWQAIDIFSQSSATGIPRYAFASALILSGTLIFVGWLTPIAGLLVLVLEIFGSFGANGWSAINVYGILLAAAIVLLGPGSFSIDALMFGRREIIIPR